jgi:hypothetical protein
MNRFFMSFYHLIRHKTTLKNPFENFEYFFISKFVKILSGNLNIRNLLNMDQEATTEWPTCDPDLVLAVLHKLSAEHCRKGKQLQQMCCICLYIFNNVQFIYI